MLIEFNHSYLLQKKCESYWPEDEAQEYHGIIVECLSTHDLPDITTRVFKLSKVKMHFYAPTLID